MTHCNKKKFFGCKNLELLGFALETRILDFYHTSTLIRRRKNKIEGLLNAHGLWISDQIALEDMAMHFYSALFSSSGVAPRKFPRGHFPIIAAEKLSLLRATCSSDEVYKAVRDMSPHKAPGPDGFNAGFFQKTWPITAAKVTSMVQHVIEGGELPTRLAEVLLALIPKTEHPESIAQFRHISLCNVTYKIITKVITNRLREVMGDLIAPPQCSFIQGRQMVDNVIICQELLHSMKRRQGSTGATVLKLDLA